MCGHDECNAYSAALPRTDCRIFSLSHTLRGAWLVSIAAAVAELRVNLLAAAELRVLAAAELRVLATVEWRVPVAAAELRVLAAAEHC